MEPEAECILVIIGATPEGRNVDFHPELTRVFHREVTHR
jgi:hypothetical protein